MANPYHDETGRFCSANEMGAAVERLKGEGRWEEAFQLSNEYHAASKSELEATIAEMKSFGVPQPVAAGNVSSITDARVQKAKAAPVAAKPKADAAKAQLTPSNTFALPKTHTYKPAGVIPGEGGEYYSRKFTGENAGDSWRSVTDISKDIRADLAEAQAKGYLPKNLSFSVVSDKYSGGQSLRVKIQGGKDKDLFATGSEEVRPEYGNKIYTDDALEVSKRVQGIVDSYRTDNSDPQWDYFNTNFYGFVNIESERDARFREKEANAAKEKREGYKQRKDLLAKTEPEQNALFVKHANKVTKDGSGSFGFVPGTQMLVVEGEAKSYSYQGWTTRHVKEVYDLTGYTVRGGGDVEASLKDMDLYDLRAVLDKRKFFPVKARKTRR